MASVSYITGDGERVVLGQFGESAEQFYDRSGNTMVLAVPTGATFSFDVNTTAELTLSPGTLTLSSSRSASTNLLTVENSETANGASDAQIDITSGGASGGDPAILFLITGAGVMSMGLDNTDSDIFAWSNNAALGTTNRMTLAVATGLLSVDADGGGGDDPVLLFDAYDDALELRKFAYSNDAAEVQGFVTAQQRDENRVRMVEMGVAKWAKQEEGADHLMLHIQPMLKLLAGGIYQTRQLLDETIAVLTERLEGFERRLVSG